MKLNLGVNNVSNANYHEDVEFLSSSDYKLLLKDPAVFYQKKYGSTEAQAEQEHFNLGSYVHSLLLEGHITDSEFCVYPGLVKRGKEYDVFKLQNPDKTILNKGQHESAMRMMRGFKARPEAVQLLKGTLSEHTVCVDFNGIPTKVRADAINVEAGYIVDVKTTAFEADRDNFVTTCQQWDYPLSAALYTTVMEQFYGKPFIFYWLVLSKKDGTCELYKMSQDTRDKGDRNITKAAKIYKQCLATGLWTSAEKPVIVLNESSYEILEV